MMWKQSEYKVCKFLKWYSLWRMSCYPVIHFTSYDFTNKLVRLKKMENHDCSRRKKLKKKNLRKILVLIDKLML